MNNEGTVTELYDDLHSERTAGYPSESESEAPVKAEKKHKPRKKGSAPKAKKAHKAAAKKSPAKAKAHKPRKASAKKAAKQPAKKLGPVLHRKCKDKSCKRAFKTRDARMEFCSRRCGNRNRQQRFYAARKKAFAAFLKMANKGAKKVQHSVRKAKAATV